MDYIWIQFTQKKTQFGFTLTDFLLFCSYFISRKPIDEKPDFYFRIDQSGLNGTVSLKNLLDYEAVPKHIVRILAIDRGRTQDPENECQNYLV